MRNAKIWLYAFRLKTLPLALASIGMASFLAASEHKFRIDIFIWATITAIFLQVLSNLANDYGDTINGADNKLRKGPIRVVQAGIISSSTMKIAIIISAILSLLSGLILLNISIGIGNLEFYIFLCFGIASMLAAYFYTAGKNPYGYAGFGDIAVIIFFGLLAVLGTFFLYTNEFRILNILPALSIGLFSTTVLNINNIRDIESDRVVGKKSIPVRLGHRKAIIYHIILLCLGFTLSVVYVSFLHFSYHRLLLLIIAIPLAINAKAIIQVSDYELFNLYLKQMILITLLFTILFGISIL